MSSRCPSCGNTDDDHITRAADIRVGPVWSRPITYLWCRLCGNTWGSRPAGEKFRTSDIPTD